MNDETEIKTLMIHVERIVRPIAATANRKLRMRRELLAHLQSALEEERPNGGTESELLTRAKSRLGDPTQLTQQLQFTVPRLEQIFLKKLPAPKPLDRWEQRSGKAWNLVTMTQALAISGFSMLFAILTFGLTPTVPLDRRNDFFNMQSGNSQHFLLICVAADIILAAIPILIMSLNGKLIATGWRSRAVFLRAFIILILELLWLALIYSQVLHQPPTLTEMASKFVISILMITFNIFVVHFISKMANHHREWKQLNLAE